MIRNYQFILFCIVFLLCKCYSNEITRIDDKLGGPQPMEFFSNQVTTENFYTPISTPTGDLHNQWFRDWYQRVRDAMLNLRRRLGFRTSNVSAGLDTDTRFFHGAREPFQTYVQAIFPGTLWCGRGNKARFSEDLGRYNDTDFCCREHDNCPDSIRPSESRYGLENAGLFTRSHCDCDLKFYSCLKKVNSIVSRQMGVSYFNVLGPQCFRLERPVRDCAIVYRRRCILYEFENTDRLEYQWFDLPKF